MSHFVSFHLLYNIVNKVDYTVEIPFFVVEKYIQNDGD